MANLEVVEEMYPSGQEPKGPKIPQVVKQTRNWPRYKGAPTTYGNAIREAKGGIFKRLCEAIELTIETSRL